MIEITETNLENSNSSGSGKLGHKYKLYRDWTSKNPDRFNLVTSPSIIQPEFYLN